MEISNETRDRLVKDLSDDELKQELASREERKPGLYRRKGNTIVVLFVEEKSGHVVIRGRVNEVGRFRRDFRTYKDVDVWEPVTLTVKE